ncbi:MAG: SDR family oxidoreductase [Flavisolibacter sp.]
MLKILVTGANGFVGNYLIRELLQNNYFVIAIGRGESRLDIETENLIYCSVDFTNNEELKLIFEEYNPDVVIHSGAMSKPDECELNKEAAFRTNVTGTINLLSHSKRAKSFFVYISTDFVFSGSKENYDEESDDTYPVNYYGETKLLAEGEVKKYEFDWAIVRTVLVYGKPLKNRQNLLTNTAAALQKGEALKIFDDQVKTPTYVGDLVSGIVSIVKKKAKGVYHLSGKDILTPYKMSIAVADHLNLDASLIARVNSNEFNQPAKRPAKCIFDLTKAQKELDYNPISFEEGLKKTFD